MTKRKSTVDEHIAFHLSLDQTINEIKSHTNLTELKQLQQAAFSDLKPSKHLPRFAAQEIKRTISKRIIYLENLYNMLDEVS